MSEPIYEAEYLEGIEQFNAHNFFEAHEVWEAIWKRTQGPNRLFYKALIHAAVALHHFGNGNLRGARKVFGSCMQYLAAYAPDHLGMDVGMFLAQMRQCFVGLDSHNGEPAGITLDKTMIPRIVLRSAPLATHRGEA